MIKIYSNVKFPQMRQGILSALESLSNQDEQREKWIDANYPHSFWDTLRLTGEFLEDVELDNNPEETMGEYLINRQECDIIQPVYQTLNKLYRVIGENQADSAYINSPLWDEVVKAAKAAFDVFMANEEEARKINPHPWNGEEDWPQTPSVK